MSGNITPVSDDSSVGSQEEIQPQDPSSLQPVRQVTDEEKGQHINQGGQTPTRNSSAARELGLLGAGALVGSAGTFVIQHQTSVRKLKSRLSHLNNMMIDLRGTLVRLEHVEKKKMARQSKMDLRNIIHTLTRHIQSTEDLTFRQDS